MISRGQRIRDYLREHGRPCAPAEIAAALGLPTLPVCHTIGNMLRAGMLGRTGAGRAFHYYLAREAKPAVIYATPEEKRARCAELARLAHKARGGMSRAEYMAQFSACRAQREAAAAERAAKREQHDREKALRAERRRAIVKSTPEEVTAARRERDRRRHAEKRAQRRLSQAQRILAHAPAATIADRMHAIEAPAAKVRPETIEEWKARTGKKVEVIPAHWNQEIAA